MQTTQQAFRMWELLILLHGGRVAAQGRAGILRYNFLLILGAFVEEAWEESPGYIQSLPQPLSLPQLVQGTGRWGVGKGAVIMLFLCNRVYLIDKMGPAFGNWKSFPHNLKQHLHLLVIVTRRLISQPAGSICRGG